MRDTWIPALKLFAVALVAALLLGTVNAVTREPIARYAAEKAEAARLAVLSDATRFDQESDTAYIGYGADGTVCGYTVETQSKGYGGMITVTIGLSSDGQVVGVQINSHSETEGLGSRCTDENWLAQFVGSQSAALKADGGKIDAVSGATISSRAVTAAVQKALDYYAEHWKGDVTHE